MSVVKRLHRVPLPAVGPALINDYRGDRLAVLRRLNAALATQIVCMLRYRRHHFMAKARAAMRIADEFLVHADEELANADLIAERIIQLGGEPDFAPDTLKTRSHADYVAVSSTVEMVQENLLAQRIAIESLQDLIESLAKNDPPTRRLLESILSIEQAHADELRDLLQSESRT